MNTNQLKDKFISVKFSGYGTYLVEFTRYKKNYKFKTHNMEAIDCIKSNEGCGMYTLKQALQALYSEGLRSCGLV